MVTEAILLPDQGVDATPAVAPDVASLMDPLTDPDTGFHHRMTEVFHLD